jgi:hypothetical protein
MIIALTPDISNALNEKARQQGTTPEALALSVLREKLALPAAPGSIPLQPADAWEERVVRAAIDCGVSLSNEAVSSEGIYE